MYFSEPTDRGGFEIDARISQSDLNLMLDFTHGMGSVSGVLCLRT